MGKVSAKLKNKSLMILFLKNARVIELFRFRICYPSKGVGKALKRLKANP
jgi:hypothetical protein